MLDLVIGLTGAKAGGKGEVAEYLKTIGFAYLSLSDIVRNEASRRKMEKYTTKDLQDIGNELRQQYGLGVLAKMTIDEMQKMKLHKYVIDGIRNPGEVEELRKLENFYLIAVDAEQYRRWEFMQKRARASDPKTWEEFLVMDNRDRGSGEVKIGQQVSACINLADYKIENSGTLFELHEKIEEVLKQIGLN